MNDIKKLLALLLCASMVSVPLFGCLGSGKPEKLSRGVKRNDVSASDLGDGSGQKRLSAAAALFRENCAREDGNVCISPLSLYIAIAMTQNGGQGDTLEQIRAFTGEDCDTLNAHMKSYISRIEDDSQLMLADSLWVTDNEDDFRINEDFLQTCVDYYGADVYAAPFPPKDSSATVKKINSWTDKHTGGMIDKLLDEIPDGTVMYLINAAAFDAEWESIYTDSNVSPSDFYCADGTVSTVDMMYSNEGIYVSDSDAHGFIKTYKDEKYGFMALLPDEGVSLDDYIASFDGERLDKLMSSADAGLVAAGIPKFSFEYEHEQSDVLKALGVEDAFDDSRAELKALGDCADDRNIVISRVLHKTYIAVDEKGTKAGAASAVEFAARCAMPQSTVILNRPFIFAIIDFETRTPVFLGVVRKL